MTDLDDLIARLREPLTFDGRPSVSDGQEAAAALASLRDEVVSAEARIKALMDGAGAASQMALDAMDENRGLRDEVARKDAALQFYATGYYIGDGDCNGYVMPQDLRGTGDTGQIARAALTDQ